MTNKIYHKKISFSLEISKTEDLILTFCPWRAIVWWKRNLFSWRDNYSDAGISYFQQKLSPTPQESERESKYLVISKPLNLHFREGKQRNASVSQPPKQQSKPRQPRSKKTSYKSRERKFDSKSETRQQRICLIFGED